MATPHLLPGERIFHLALAREWNEAAAAGEYRLSTLGRSLDDEGFIHASRRHQVQGVFDAFYREVTEPLLLLEIDPELVHAPVRLEVPEGAADAFPHLYGPLRVEAVVAAHPVVGTDVWHCASRD